VRSFIRSRRILREHPEVVLAYAGVKAVISKSVNRIFYPSSIKYGLPIIICLKPFGSVIQVIRLIMMCDMEGLNLEIRNLNLYLCQKNE